MLEQGLVEMYLVPPDRPNFISFGLAFRAAGRGLRSLIISCSHQELMSGYNVASRYLSPFLDIRLIDLPQYTDGRTGAPRTCKHFLIDLQQSINGGDFDLVHILDIEKLLDSSLIKLEDLITLCAEKPKHRELILSGSNAPPPALEIAQLVTKVVVERRSTLDLVDHLDSGTIEIVTGNGKGKTTYCLGKALLASAMGMSCLFLQFIKSPMRYGETIAADKIPNFTMKTMGRGFIFPKKGKIAPQHREAARDAWNEFREQLDSQKYQLIVLDEINIALYYDLLDAEEVNSAIRERPRETSLLLSGRNAHPDVLKMATTVIEMQEVKHPFQKGIKARKGIEF